MIFVTVGTHEQQFNRLLEEVDRLVGNGIITEEVFIQTGYSTYEPKYCKWDKNISFKEMEQKIKDANIVITHGGPSSFIAPLQIGKIPIVVPRRIEFSEHVNNHQVDFVEQVSKRMGAIIPVFEIKDLENCIVNYKSIKKDIKKDKLSNNEEFCKKFELAVNKLFE